MPARHYLNESGGWKSWLLTTDHKRIGLLYLFSITVMFFLGGFFALLVRLELLTPAGDLMTSDVYNRVFTMHGVIMVFFFLIPSIPATLGNFLIPLMLGAKDLAFPRINLLSWYLYIIGGLFGLVAADRRRRRHRLDVLHAVQLDGLELPRAHGCGGRVHRRVLVHPHRPQLHRHRPPDAGARDDVVPDAAVRLVALRDQPDHDPGHAGRGHHDPARGLRARAACRGLRPDDRRRPGAVPAPVLVLLAPGRLHHGAAGDGRDQRDHPGVLPEEHLRLQLHRVLEPGHRGDRLPGVGPPHVRLRRDAVFGAGLLDHHLHGGGALRDQDVQLDGHALQGVDLVRDPDALRVRVHRAVPDRRADRVCSSRRSASTCTCTTPTSSSPTSTTSWWAGR